MIVIPIVTCALGTVTKELVQGPEDLEIRGQVETEIHQNAEMSPENFRRLAVT